MTTIEQLRTKLPQFTWIQENKNASIFGSISISQITKRINKDLYKLSNVNIFISSKMSPLGSRPFYYAICYQKAEIRPYRHKHTFNAEYQKIYVSDKNWQGIVNKLVEQIDMNKFVLSK